jgi:hypothetical protein
MHFETRNTKTPFMYVFAEPVTEEQADEIQSKGEAAQKHFARTVVGVGKDDPEVQEAWQNIQDEVDEQVDEDRAGKLSDTSEEEQGSEQEEATESSEESDVEPNSDEAPRVSADDALAADDEPRGPLMGWTLTVRSKVNGGYVDRPRRITAEDEWKLEYHIQEIPEESRWRLYNAVKDRRHGLIGLETEEVDKSLQNYRNLIQRFSTRGREWREAQDKLNEEMGIQMYKPLGPGSEAYATTADEASEKP